MVLTRWLKKEVKSKGTLPGKSPWRKLRIEIQSEPVRSSPNFESEWIRGSSVEYYFKPNESELSTRMNPRLIRTKFLNRMNPDFQSEWIRSSFEESFKPNEYEVSIRMNPKWKSEWISCSSEENYKLICPFQLKFRILMNFLLIQIIILLSFKNSNTTTVKQVWQVEWVKF